MGFHINILELSPGKAEKKAMKHLKRFGTNTTMATMIKIMQGNLFESKADVFVNTTNTFGVMGKGIALQFKQKFPKMYNEYRDICSKKQFDIGQILIHETGDNNPKFIVSFPTKKHWRNPSQIEWIKIGLKVLCKWCNDNKIQSIAIPSLGCSNGGLNWKDVCPLICESFNSIETMAYIFEPYG